MTTVRPKKFICPFCRSKIKYIDYKDVATLAGFITFYRSIQSRFRTGCCVKHQKQLRRAIKRARQMALLAAVRYEN